MENKHKNDKSQRVRLHLANTAKEMILESGMENISIRKIAAESGYAYATIYNHFKSLDELLWLTRNLFIDDVNDHMAKHSIKRVFNNEDLFSIFKTYIDYFVDHPQVYHFLYFYSLDCEQKTSKSSIESEEHSESFLSAFEYLSQQKSIENVAQITKSIMYSLHGLLTLSFSQNDQLSTDDVYKELKSIIHFVTRI